MSFAPKRNILRRSKAEAAELLGRSGLRLKLVLLSIFALLIVMTALVITPNEYLAMWVSVGVFALVSFPILLGHGRMVYDADRGREVFLFSALRANMILPRTWLVIAVMTLPTLAVAGLFPLFLRLWGDIGELEIVERSVGVRLCLYGAALLAALSVFALILMLAMRLFFFPAYAMRGDMSLIRALVGSWRSTDGRMWQSIGFLLSFVGWFALGVLSLGIILIYHTLPYFAVSYMRYAENAIK